MPVTTSRATADSGSQANAMSTRRAPTWIQGKRSASSRCWSGGSRASSMQPADESRNEMPTVAHASQPTGPLPRRRWSHEPPSPSVSAPARGRSGIRARYGAGIGSLMRFPYGSSAQPVRRVHVDGLERLVDAEHDGEADRRPGSGEHDDEDGEDLAIVPAAAVARECDVVDVGRVHDELDAHQDAERVAARDHAEQPEAEHDGAEHDEVLDREAVHQPRSSLRETMTAPMSATRRTSEAISKGRTKSPRNAVPTP